MHSPTETVVPVSCEVGSLLWLDRGTDGEGISHHGSGDESLQSGDEDERMQHRECARLKALALDAAQRQRWTAVLRHLKAAARMLPHDWKLRHDQSLLHLALGNAMCALAQARLVRGLGAVWKDDAIEAIGRRREAEAYLVLDWPDAGERAARHYHHLLLENDSESDRKGLTAALARVRASRKDPNPDRPRTCSVPLRVMRETAVGVAEDHEGCDRSVAGSCAPIGAAPPVNVGDASRVDVGDVEGMGRGLLARRRVRKDQTVLLERPFIAVDLSPTERCRRCTRSLSALQRKTRCPKCAWALCFACESENSADDSKDSPESLLWRNLHALMCPLWSEIEAQWYAPARRSGSAADVTSLLTLWLVAVAICRHGDEGVPSPFHLDEISRLHLPERQVREAVTPMLLPGRLCSLFGLPEHRTWLDMDWCLAASSILTVDAFRFGSDPACPSTSCAGMYPLASLLNHGCRPNVAYDFDTSAFGNAVRVRALRDIDEGEPLCISYNDRVASLDNVEQRREALKEMYGFECRCTACTLPQGDQGA